MTSDWLNLRSIDGSQHLGSEELCCQLARHEVPEEARFIRKGSPDAGVECYAIFSFSETIAVVDEEDMKPVDYAPILSWAKTARDSMMGCICEIECHWETSASEKHPRIRLFEAESNHLQDIMDSIDAIDQFCRSEKAQLSNTPALLLVGDAGTGQTHLFCRVAEERTKCGLPTVLLLGEHFTSASDPWDQILSLLGLDCERDALLDAAGEVSQCRTLILIDALNESRDPAMWKSHLPGMLKALEPYAWVGTAVSVRSCYEERVIPPSLLAIAELMVKQSSQLLTREEACRAMNAVHPSTGFKKSLFNLLTEVNTHVGLAGI